MAGSSDTGIDMETVAKNIVFKNITLITLNYRLGPFGFMTIQYENRVEGNFGIWDQKLALEWIQRNIKQFNGDPTKVTVMGESAGAAAVSALALSPLTKSKKGSINITILRFNASSYNHEWFVYSWLGDLSR